MVDGGAQLQAFAAGERGPALAGGRQALAGRGQQRRVVAAKERRLVIERGRIGHAGAFLPISLETNLPKAFGTRHRAAIGLTDRTDAVCVLVSEERGTVAVVVGGVVTPVVDANDLRQRLQEALEGQRAPEVAHA